MSIKPEEVSGLVRTETHKGDKNSEKPFTALLNDGRKVQLDASEARSLEKRLDKDRTRMEKEGTRAKEREPERREKTRVVSQADMQRFLRENFRRGE